jgi:hypothetical protein
MEAPCSAEILFGFVEDLIAYPEWLSIVTQVEPEAPAADDRGPAWTVELRGRVGPLTRSKRLRMVRTEHRPPERVVFERRELDGRRHAPWRLAATVRQSEGGSELSMFLRYGGSSAEAILERLLRDEIEQSKERLRASVLAQQRGSD